MILLKDLITENRVLFYELEKLLISLNFEYNLTQNLMSDLIDKIQMQHYFNNLDDISLILKNTLLKKNKFLNSIVEIKPKPKSPHILFVFGINGTGKTSSVIKITKTLETLKWKTKIISLDYFKLDNIKKASRDLDLDIIYIDSKKEDFKTDEFILKNKEISLDTDVLIFDTKGYTAITKDSVIELENITANIKMNYPNSEITNLFIFDTTYGNLITETIDIFNRKFKIDGFIATKTDITKSLGSLFSSCINFNIPVFGASNSNLNKNLIEIDFKDFINNVTDKLSFKINDYKKNLQFISK